MGGSVWELKIDPKRLREEIKNDIERRRKKKYRKKEHQERQEELQKTMTAFVLLKPKRRPVQFGRPGPLGEPQELPK